MDNNDTLDEIIDLGNRFKAKLDELVANLEAAGNRPRARQRVAAVLREAEQRMTEERCSLVHAITSQTWWPLRQPPADREAVGAALLQVIHSDALRARCFVKGEELELLGDNFGWTRSSGQPPADSQAVVEWVASLGADEAEERLRRDPRQCLDQGYGRSHLADAIEDCSR